MDKRKDLVTNIQGRVNSGAYNIGKYYKKNEKDLSEKVKFFEKKMSTGEMKPFMRPRYEQARDVLDKLRKLRGMPPLPPAPVEAVAAAAATVPVKAAPTGVLSTLAAPGVTQGAVPGLDKVTTVKRTYKKRTAAPAAAVAVVKNNTRRSPLLGNNGQALRIKIPKRGYTKRATAAVKNNTRKSPRLGNNGKPLRIKIPKHKVQFKNSSKPKSLRALREPTYNEHLQAAFNESQSQIPELYNPFTGVKYERSESPMEDVERAYILLRKIRSNTIRKAASLRRKASASGTRKSPNRNNNS
jgi:hypothetical protein